jgi:hypothetical protein
VLHNLIALPLLMFLVIASFLLAFSLRRVDRLRHLWLPALASAAAPYPPDAVLRNVASSQHY